MTFHHHCLRCDYEWDSAYECPGRCKRCLSYVWDTPPDFKTLLTRNMGARRDLLGRVEEPSANS